MLAVLYFDLLYGWFTSLVVERYHEGLYLSYFWYFGVGTLRLFFLRYFLLDGGFFTLLSCLVGLFFTFTLLNVGWVGLSIGVVTIVFSFLWHVTFFLSVMNEFWGAFLFGRYFYTLVWRDRGVFLLSEQGGFLWGLFAIFNCLFSRGREVRGEGRGVLFHGRFHGVLLSWQRNVRYGYYCVVLTSTYGVVCFTIFVSGLGLCARLIELFVRGFVATVISPGQTTARHGEGDVDGHYFAFAI